MNRFNKWKMKRKKKAQLVSLLAGLKLLRDHKVIGAKDGKWFYTLEYEEWLRQANDALFKGHLKHLQKNPGTTVKWLREHPRGSKARVAFDKELTKSIPPYITVHTKSELESINAALSYLKAGSPPFAQYFKLEELAA